LTNISNRADDIRVRITQTTQGSTYYYNFYYKPSPYTQAKSVISVDNSRFAVTIQSSPPLVYDTPPPNEPAYLDVSFKSFFVDAYTKGEIFAKTTVLQAAIDITYTQVESDNRYRRIADSYSKTEIDNTFYNWNFLIIN
jgi:hypothetical protein